jgi:hypothetical protein
MSDNTVSCTKAERELLDAMKNALPITYYACPVCNYDGLGPATQQLTDTIIAWLKEVGGKDAEKTITWLL